MRCFSKILFLLFLFLAVPAFWVLSQEAQEELNGVNLNPTEERKALEEELKKLEEQIDQYEKDIDRTEAEKKTLNNQISVLRKKINKLNLQIKESNVMIKDIGIQITDTKGSIEKTSLKIDDSQTKLKQILRTIYEEDQKSGIEILLSSNELSDFFDNLMYLESLGLKNTELLVDIKELKVSLEGQKESLDAERGDLEKVVKMQTAQKQESEKIKKETDYFLQLTEKEYKKYLEEKEVTQKKANEIRSRIFELIGVPQAPTFGEAYEMAKEIEKITGVRPAFLLAILTQESNIGKNVGQCYLKDPKTGNGIVIRTGKDVSKVMKPSRDVPPFLQIAKESGRDPYNTPVSCPMPSVGGYGGAMGPAQFIPSTWMLYRDRLKEITGRFADPWNIRDAFLASALYLADAGASKGTYNSEWSAALIYFSGSVNKKYSFYGDSVMALVKAYERDIKALE